MSATVAGSSVHYQVQSDLNRESLPQSSRDPQRKVWWMNSLAATVLGIGIFLTKEPAEFVFRPIEPEAPMQIEVVQPLVEHMVQATTTKEEEEVVEEVEVDVIQPVVVAADPSKVLFGVEVKGPTVTSANMAKVSPPPAVVPRPKPVAQTGPVVIRAGQGGIPKMEYPPEARRTGVQGSFKLLVTVSADGVIEEITVSNSTGATLLERAAKEHLRRYAKLSPGKYIVPFDFQFQ